MGIFDPMAINSAAATGLVEFGGWSAVWLVLVGVLAGAFGGILFASARPWAGSGRGLPRLAAPRLATELVGRAH
ncbi:MAG: hypothetical protein SF182_08430 [Deltaproteobacteria bacterium]|nr:hypothetical protein [Deltaproteobacteria bacterium]